MRLQQSLLDAENQQQAISAYSLTQLEVYNWGPFSALHRIAFDAKGSALIGQTGSGKTTLVDAMMTLICSQPKYNLASTGGHESDRDLMSYVRGVTGMGGDDESQHIARAGQTTTGICLQMDKGELQVRLTALLWLDGSSNSQSDLKRLWIFDQTTQQGLTDYLPLLKELGISGLKRQLKEQPGIIATDNKKAYLSQCIKFFEVGKNAFVLLNRAAGLKQLNSINDLFRDLVLDNKNFFKRANEVANEFDELKGIHAELTLAKQQQQSLLPIDKHWKKHQSTQQQLTQLKQLSHLLPRWFAHITIQLLERQIEQLNSSINKNKGTLQQQSELHKLQTTVVEDFYARYQQLGGANIEELKRQQQEQQRQLSKVQQNSRDYQQLCRTLKLNTDISFEQLKNNQQHSELQLNELQQAIKETEQLREQLTKDTLNAEDAEKEIEKEIQQVIAAPDSNIPIQFLKFQHILAQQLNLDTDSIPYIGQCIEVQDKKWQGAIERAIGSHRLRLVIPEHMMNQALKWVNQRNNHLHVRLLNEADYLTSKTPLDDGFYDKLTFKQNILSKVVKNFISSIDRHCVTSSHQLKRTPFGLTEQGLMSGQRGLFEKQDQRPLNQGWMTGFDNKNRLNELKQKRNEVQQTAKNFRLQFEAIKLKDADLKQQNILLEQLQKLEFDAINSSIIEQALALLELRLAQLQDPNSDAAMAEQQWKKAKEQLEKLQQSINHCQVEIELQQASLKQSNQQINQATQRLSNALTEQEIALAEQQANTQLLNDLNQMLEQERTALQKLQADINTQNIKLKDCEIKLGKAMQAALQIDTGALNEVATELEDIPAYLERLNLLTKEDLPNKISRFLHYLNQSSDQGVNQLLSHVETEVTRIEERIEELNSTLKGVDFQANRYLQLIPKQVMHESLNSLNKTHNHLRSAILIDDEGESHFKALMALVQQLREAVERKQTNPAKALLDPRYRLQFFVQIVDRETASIIETRSGSKGGSGGEKEIIASFILTASLSYALCPKNRTSPLFSTVILDEAFSKSSQAVAARIISALKEFGLNPLFVTPNKEMRLLREHTHSAVLVHRRQKQSTALSLSWREIDQYLTDR